MAAVIVAGVVLVTKGGGAACRRIQPKWAGVVFALVIGGAFGFGVGAVVTWQFFRMYCPPEWLNSFMAFTGTFFALIGAIEATTTAAGLGGTTKIRIGK
ncbi:MAG: hypothetical protein SGJ19_05745 [Planctomycetia bacterium]|nr:hypothetical protein [Planctomycetia bacterium]